MSLAATHDAVLWHTGPSGFEAFDAWTGRTSTLVPGMPGVGLAPYWSPNRVSVLTIIMKRPDFPVATDIYVATLGSGAYYEAMGDYLGQVISVDGWMDDYTAVVTVEGYEGTDANYRYAVDTRDGSRSWMDPEAAVTYPAPAIRASTTGDRKYSVSVSKSQKVTVRLRKTKQIIARYHLPGAGSSRRDGVWQSGDLSISPDGKFLAYWLWMDPLDHGQPKWRNYVCTLKGTGGRRIKNDYGGFAWR